MSSRIIYRLSGLALSRYRLWAIDLLINRTLVYSVLTVGLVAFSILVVAGLGALLQTQNNLGITLLATGSVVVLFQPLHARLQRAVDQLMYRSCDEPYRVISRLESRLEATLATDAVLPTIVEEDRSCQAGGTAPAVRLEVDLQRSHERLVTAREEERRRLRRDLHDGLGPQLASLTLKLETARNRLAHDRLADALLSDLTQQTQAMAAEIRRLVYALRPPALDELGLISALHELTLHVADQVVLRFDAPGCLPDLPAAVEVAVYRIAQEALTNVVRHAHARHCKLRLALDEPAGLLTLSIPDDGCGLPVSRGVGVGLVSMRERAEELGGILSIEPVPTRGTRVLAHLPCTFHQQNLSCSSLVSCP